MTRPARNGAHRAQAVYQLDFFTPGIIPSSANLRKQMRHIPNFRYTARGRPQSRHRRTSRVLNFGGRCALMIFDLLAIVPLSSPETARIGPAFARHIVSPPPLSRRPEHQHSIRIPLSEVAARQPLRH